jgi:hypothetical protein
LLTIDKVSQYRYRYTPVPQVRQITMTFSWRSAVVVVAAVLACCSFQTAAFSSIKGEHQQRPKTTTTTTTTIPSTRIPGDQTSRRNFLIAVPIVTGILSGGTSSAAQANDDLFKPNPLTNGMLEKFRIWEQAEADNLKYDGELAPGDAGNKGKTDAYPKLLVPILEIAIELKSLDGLVHNSENWSQVQEIIKQPKYDKVPFKKAFNAFADNIYYSDPDRANAYLGGGATPKTEQSIAYLLRNDILSNVEALQAEIDYLLGHPEEDANDLYEYARVASSIMQKYLELVPPNEMLKAKELLAAR